VQFSSKGAVGLMQLMPMTAQRLLVSDRCNIDQNVSGGVRYLAWLVVKFHGDLRLATAAYNAGENIIGRRGLAYSNPDVVAYVSHIRATYLRFAQTKSGPQETTRKEIYDENLPNFGLSDKYPQTAHYTRVGKGLRSLNWRWCQYG
jgi:soluble lytic murein transglycosylase-like protein